MIWPFVAGVQAQPPVILSAGLNIIQVETGSATSVVGAAGSQSLVAIDPNIAINPSGMIAFTGSTNLGSGVFLLTSRGVIKTLANSTGRTFAGVGISSGLNVQVLQRELVPGPSFVLRQYGLFGTSDILGSSVTSSGPKDFDSVTSTVDMNQSGVAAAGALVNGSTATALLAGSARPLTRIASFPTVIGLRPQISDTSLTGSPEVVVRDHQGRIVCYLSDNSGNGSPSFIAASSASGFGTDTGNRPGISGDASGVAFSGNRGNGAGVYLAVRLSAAAPAQLINVAGGELNDGFSAFPSEQRVGVFSYSVAGFRVYVTAFVAEFAGKLGIYTRTVHFVNGVLQPLSNPRRVVQIGDALAGAQVASFALYRPLNNSSTVAFHATLSNGSQVIASNSLPLEGVDFIAQVPSGWGDTIYDNESKSFVVLRCWTGIGPDITNLSHNYGAIAPSKIGVRHIGAYAIINNNNASSAIQGDDHGHLQVARAFAAMGQAGFDFDSLPFLALDIENNTVNGAEVPPVLGPVEYVARIADSIQATWTRGIPAIIYTSSRNWTTLTNSSVEIAGTQGWDLPLWDASTAGNPANTLDGFTPYGSWAQRLGRQYLLSPPINLVAGVDCDLNIFDPTLFDLTRPPVECVPGPRLSELSITKGTGGLMIKGKFTNDTPVVFGSLIYPLSPAVATRINSCRLQISGFPAVNAPVSLGSPIRLDTIGVNGASAFDFSAPVAFDPPVGALVVVQMTYSCGGKSGTVSGRTTVK